VGAAALTARVLCRRHNEALSPPDNMIGSFYDVLLGAVNRRDVGEHVYDGEDLERWAKKLMFGIGASGNVSYPEVGRVIAPAIPDEYLRVLFAEDELPTGCGFKYVGAELPGLRGLNALSYMINKFSGGDQAAFGITVKILWCFQFLTSLVAPLERLGDVRLVDRPGGFVLGVPERGRIYLRWRGVRPLLILKLTKD
jgi:hypothetical protein